MIAVFGSEGDPVGGPGEGGPTGFRQAAPGAFQAFLLFSGLMVTLFLGQGLVGGAAEWLSLVLTPAASLVLTLGLALPFGLRASLQWRRPRLAQVVLGGVVGAFAALFVSGASDLYMRVVVVPVEVVQQMSELVYISDLPDLLYTLGVMAVLPGFYEELAFRGFIQGALSAQWRPWPGILITASLFAGLHFLPWFFPFYVLLGSVFGLLCWYSRSVIPAMVTHAAYNAATIVVANLGARLGWMEQPGPTFPLPVAGALAVAGAVGCGWGVLRVRAQRSPSADAPARAAGSSGEALADANEA
jgi:membrane protease YdiL (CAAX protease family)